MRAVLMIGFCLILAACGAVGQPAVTAVVQTATARPAVIVDCRTRDAEGQVPPRGTLATLTMIGGWVYDDSSTLAVNTDGALEFAHTERAFLNMDLSQTMTETVDTYSGVVFAADLQRLQSLIASPAFSAIKDCRHQEPAADGGYVYLSIIDAQGEQTFNLSVIEMPATLRELSEIVHSMTERATTLQSRCVYTRDRLAAPVLQFCEQR